MTKPFMKALRENCDPTLLALDTPQDEAWMRYQAREDTHGSAHVQSKEQHNTNFRRIENWKEAYGYETVSAEEALQRILCRVKVKREGFNA